MTEKNPFLLAHAEDEFDEDEDFTLDYETMYGHCLAENPYWFIPDLECNSENELLSWRHALLSVKQGTFESPSHYFWKNIDGCILHGHNSPWGMGITAFSDKVNVWEVYPDDKWLLELADSTASDEQFITSIQAYVKKLKAERGKWNISKAKL